MHFKLVLNTSLNLMILISGQNVWRSVKHLEQIKIIKIKKFTFNINIETLLV